MKCNIMLTLVFVLLCNALTAQFTDDTKKAMYIINFAKKITWPNEHEIDKYVISVLGSNEIYQELKRQALIDTVKGKPIEVVRIKRIRDVGNSQIFFVEKMPETNIVKVWAELKNKHVLLVSDGWKRRELVMINFNNDPNNFFEVNNKNIQRQGLIVSDKILLQGGGADELKKIYLRSEKELQEQRDRVEQQKAEIAKQQVRLDKLNKEMKITISELDKKKVEIEEQQAMIENQRLEYESLISEVEEQKRKLSDNMRVVEAQEREMKEQKYEIDLRTEKLKDVNEEILRQQTRLKNKDLLLDEQTDQIEMQKKMLIIVVGFLFLLAILAFVILHGYRVKRRINKQLEEKNQAIIEQKEEIEAQSKELEKLSIVASETDNAVLIMDKHGNYEWVNESYTRMFGFTIDQLLDEKNTNIDGPGTPLEVSETIQKCFRDKVTVTYQFGTKTRDGQNLWIQATLTPIIDEFGEIRKVIAIDSDVTKIKEAEFEIQQQAEELSAQAEELQRTNLALEKEREHTMGSIRYGLTIQQAILPLKRDMDKFFDSFVIYKPKDVVSGDFYWYTSAKGDEIIKERFFIAAVDCTGHGVPGAFMSLIGNRLLNEIVNEKHIYSPSVILNKLNEGVIKALRQDATDSNDGMDVCLCCIEKTYDNVYRLNYGGAKRPLYYFPKGTDEIMILDGTRKSIGGAKATRNSSEFTDQFLMLRSGDTLYLTTDGLIDQNSPDRKRFSSQRFFKVLERVVNLPLVEQKEIIEYEFDTYRQSQPQRDDVTVVGVKLI